jgi:hypothetical protein
MSNDNRGFFDDDFDDEAPTQFRGNQGVPPPQQPPRSPYDPAEAETRLPHGNPPPSSANRPYDPPLDPTRLPGQTPGMPGGRVQGGSPYSGMDDVVDETRLGPDENVGPLGFLIVKRPLHNRGHVHRLPALCNIGRKEGHIRLHDSRVSGTHARIRLLEDPGTGEPVFMLIDMDSKTGTFMNDNPQRIESRVQLKQGDEIKIGDHVFVFMMLLD